MVRKLKNHAYAQCEVVTESQWIRFISYDTIVMHYNRQNGDLFCTGTYSQTTRKQIGWFMKEYFGYASLSYHTAKRLVEKGEKYNTITEVFTELTEEETKFIHDLRYH